MKPAEFEYVAPTNLQEALGYLSTHGGDAKILAGGQSLVPLLNMRLSRPTLVIDINRVQELDFIEERGGGIAIGATVRQADAEASPLLAQHCPLVVEAIKHIGHPQIRNQGTVVGCLAHHDPAAELPAVAVTLGARLIIAGPNRQERQVDAEGFFVTNFTTVLRPDEILTAIWFPKQEPGEGSAFVEVARRHGDFALAGAATTLKLNPDGTVAQTRIGLAGVSDHPVRCHAAEAGLQGQPATGESFAAAGQAAAADGELDPVDEVHATAEYRRQVTAVLVERALAKAKERINS